MDIKYLVECECGRLYGSDGEVDPASTPEAAIYAALQNGWGLQGCQMLCLDCVADSNRDDIVTVGEHVDTRLLNALIKYEWYLQREGNGYVVYGEHGQLSEQNTDPRVALSEALEDQLKKEAGDAE